MRVNSACGELNKKIPAVLVGRPGVLTKGGDYGKFKAE
jgi:hypothetical protein